MLCDCCTQQSFMQEVSKREREGQRVLLLAHTEKKLTGDVLPEGLKPVALLLLEDVIRPEAQEVFSFFQNEGVELIVISGDSAKTADAIARRAGISGIKGYLDTMDLSEEELRKAEEERSFKLKEELIKTIEKFRQQEDQRKAEEERKLEELQKAEVAKAKQQAEQQKKRYRQMNVCQYCGGSFIGLFSKKCKVCGRPKDYT